jgi:hypothetical protein
LSVSFYPSRFGYLGFILLRKNKIIVFTKSLLKTEEFIMVMKFAFIAYLCNAMQFLSYRMDFWFVDYFRGSTSLGIFTGSSAGATILDFTQCYFTGAV